MSEITAVGATLANEVRTERYTQQLRLAVPRILSEGYVEDLFDDLAPRADRGHHDDDEYLAERDAFSTAVREVAGELTDAWNRDVARVAAMRA